MYALILAGGGGTRLWPYSRSSRPKQFLSLQGQTSQLQETVARILPRVPIERVLVVTGQAYAGLVAEQLPMLPAANLLVEPAGRGTAPCIGLAALELCRRDPEALMVVLSADHVIAQGDELLKALEIGARAAERGYLVALGARPTAPSTAYGYIRRGAPLGEPGCGGACAVQSFVEKPGASTAQAYLDHGGYDWNTGIFVWRAGRILEELRLYRPWLASHLAQIGAAAGTAREQEVLHAIWGQIEHVAIDVAVMEQCDRAVVVPVEMGWSDVGDWSAFADTLSRDAHGNAVVGAHLGLDTRNSLVYGSTRLVTTIGVDDLLIIDTPDALLICPRSRAQEVRALVERVRAERETLA
jgi:mannose-1-phosphate guanylyltransferase